LAFADWWEDRVISDGINVGTANKNITHIGGMIRNGQKLGCVYGDFCLRSVADAGNPAWYHGRGRVYPDTLKQIGRAFKAGWNLASEEWGSVQMSGDEIIMQLRKPTTLTDPGFEISIEG
jgi:hypothetical protein